MPRPGLQKGKRNRAIGEGTRVNQKRQSEGFMYGSFTTLFEPEPGMRENRCIGGDLPAIAGGGRNLTQEEGAPTLDNKGGDTPSEGKVGLVVREDRADRAVLKGEKKTRIIIKKYHREKDLLHQEER